MAAAGVSAVVGAYASAICLATTQTAARHGLPHVVDVGVADQIVERGLKNTFRFGPGYRSCTERAIQDLAALNQAAGKPARTVMIVHEDSLFGAGTAALLSKSLPEHGFEVKEVIKHPNPTRDFNNIVLRMRSVNPDIVIPANYYNEYALLLRHEAAEGAAQGDLLRAGRGGVELQVPQEYPDVAHGIIDCNHWFNPRTRVAPLKARVEQKGAYFSYEVFMTYTSMFLLADALERAKSADRAAIIEALAASAFSDHLMPYGPTRFVDGQNTGARPADAGPGRRHPGHHPARVPAGGRAVPREGLTRCRWIPPSSSAPCSTA